MKGHLILLPGVPGKVFVFWQLESLQNGLWLRIGSQEGEYLVSETMIEHPRGAFYQVVPEGMNLVGTIVKKSATDIQPEILLRSSPVSVPQSMAPANPNNYSSIGAK